MSYIGPGDLLPGAKAFYGFRGYTGQTTGHVVTVRRGSDGTTSDFDVTNGVFDLAGLKAFLAGTSGYVTKMYDQTGTGNHVLQATAALQPQVVFDTALGGNLALNFTGTQYLVTAGNVTQATPFSLAAVVNPVALAPAVSTVIIGGTGVGTHTDAQITLGSFNDAVTIGGSTIGIFMSAAFGLWHRILGVINGATSTAWADGNSKTGQIDASATLATPLSLGYGDPGYDAGPPYFNGRIAEAAFYPSGLTTAQALSLQGNQGQFYSLSDVNLLDSQAPKFFVITQTTAAFTLGGGKYLAEVTDSYGWLVGPGLSVSLDTLGPNGTTWLPVISAWAADGVKTVSLPAGQYRFTITTSDTSQIGVSAGIAHVPGVAP